MFYHSHPLILWATDWPWDWTVQNNATFQVLSRVLNADKAKQPSPRMGRQAWKLDDKLANWCCKFALWGNCSCHGCHGQEKRGTNIWVKWKIKASWCWQTSRLNTLEEHMSKSYRSIFEPEGPLKVTRNLSLPFKAFRRDSVILGPSKKRYTISQACKLEMGSSCKTFTLALRYSSCEGFKSFHGCQEKTPTFIVLEFKQNGRHDASHLWGLELVRNLFWQLIRNLFWNTHADLDTCDLHSLMGVMGLKNEWGSVVQ